MEEEIELEEFNSSIWGQHAWEEEEINTFSSGGKFWAKFCWEVLVGSSGETGVDIKKRETKQINIIKREDMRDGQKRPTLDIDNLLSIIK